MKPYYQDDAVTIYHGDCREIVPGLGRFDLLLTDPPYEISTSGGGIGGRRKYLKDIKGFTDGGFDESILDGFDNWACFCSIAQMPRLIERAAVRRWMLVTWNKPNPTPLVNGNYLPDTEYIVHSFPSNGLCGKYEDRARFIVYPAQQHNLHPNEKPVAVVSKMILVGTRKGQTIIDPFAGSGTTGRAAKDLGRKCVCIEREERYCEIAAKRMAQSVLPLDQPPEKTTCKQSELVI
jgi:DNA modification methylase